MGNMLLNVHYGIPGVYSSFARRNIALAYIDLGSACRFPAGSDPSTWIGTGYWGTIDHAAPEVPRGSNRNSQPYHLPPVDVSAIHTAAPHIQNGMIFFAAAIPGLRNRLSIHARLVVGADIL